MGKRWLEIVTAGHYTTPLAYTGSDMKRYYSVKLQKGGGWLVEDHSAAPWPPVLFPTLKDAEIALKRLPVLRTNIMTRKEFYEAWGTPYYCSPSSETYWSS